MICGLRLIEGFRVVMSQIQLKKLNKEELIKVIKGACPLRPLRELNTTSIYYTSRSKKITEKEKAVSEAIFANLEEQGKVAGEGSKVKDDKKKFELLERLGILRDEMKGLKVKIARLHKQSTDLFKECYGKNK